MCGVPHHALEGYLGKLLAAGLKVAICDQVEDPAQAKGLVKREVTRVVTPGTLSDPGCSKARRRTSSPASSGRGRPAPGPSWTSRPGPSSSAAGGSPRRRWRTSPCCAPARCSSTAARSGVPAGDRRLGRAGVPLPHAARRATACSIPSRAGELLLRQFGAGTLRGFGLEEGEPAVRAAAAALAYAQETQKSGLAHVRGLAVREAGDRLILDASTLANLEVFASQRASAAGHGAAPRHAPRRARPHRHRPRRPHPARVAAPPAASIPRRSPSATAAVGELAADNPRARAPARAAGPHGRSRAPARPRRAGHAHPARGRGPARRPGRGAGRARRARGGRSIRAPRRSSPSSPRPIPCPELHAELARMLEAAPAAQPPGGRRHRRRRRSAELDRYRSLDPRQQAAHPGARGARARAHRHLVAQDPLQQGLRLLPGGHAGEPGAGAGGLHPQADPGQRRALRDAGDQGAGGADPLRRGAAGRAGAGVLPRAGRRRSPPRPRASPRWPTPSAPSTPSPPSPRWRRASATCGR